MSCPNGIEPLQLPLTNVTVSSDGVAVARGVEIGIGTPQQILSLQLALNDQDMFVVNSAQCNESESKCAAQLGGIFESSESETFNRVRKSEWNGTTDDSVFSSSNFIFFNEHIEYGTNASADGLPLIMNEPGITHQGGLPLAKNSTFLSDAYHSGWVPSTAYGFYFGSRSIEAPEDGLLVVGGYDTARIDGNLTDLPYDDECPTCFTVESLTYETANGTETIFDEPMTFALELYGQVIALPQSAYDRFQDASGTEYDPDTQLLTLPSDGPRGNLTARLSNGYSTTIPAEELFTHRRTTDDDGRLNIVDADQTVVVVANVSTGIPSVQGIVGWPFLSVNYIVFDHAREEFKIGKARKGGGLQSVLDGTAIEPAIEAICAPDDDGSSSGGGGSGTNAGAIAGGVVGGVAGLALIAFGVWFFLRRRKRAQAASAHQGTSPAVVEDQKLPPPPPPPPQQEKAGVTAPAGDGTGSSPVEMSPEGDPRFSMSEMASPEQINGAAGWWEKEKEKDGLQTAQPLQELEAPLERIDEKQPPGGQKGPVELP